MGNKTKQNTTLNIGKKILHGEKKTKKKHRNYEGFSTLLGYFKSWFKLNRRGASFGISFEKFIDCFNHISCMGFCKPILIPIFPNTG